MEPTKKGNGAKWVLGIVIVIVILILIMLASKKNTEAPIDNNNTQTETSLDNNSLEAELNSAIEFDNESYKSEIDQEFQ